MAVIINASTSTGLVQSADTSGVITLQNNGTNAVTVDSGNVGIGTTSPSGRNGSNKVLQISTSNEPELKISTTSSSQNTFLSFAPSANAADAWISNISAGSNIVFANGGYTTERMRLDSSGNLLVGKTSPTPATVGVEARPTGILVCTRSAGPALVVNRTSDDGDLVALLQDGAQEGAITVSGSTVSYVGGHLSRWSQLPDGSKDATLLKGTIMTNLDDMCVWVKDDETLPNEQLNKMQVSSVEGDTNVAGVFVNWTRDEDCNTDDMNVAMTGDMIIRIAEGVVVQKGDLLMSAGDGTAKPQDDDIRRSKTIAKVTSNHITCTYADGSYCVPCVLMAC